MRRLMPLALILSIIVMGCEGKKKQYIPLQTIVQQNPLSATNLGSAGNSSLPNNTPSETQPGTTTSIGTTATTSTGTTATTSTGTIVITSTGTSATTSTGTSATTSTGTNVTTTTGTTATTSNGTTATTSNGTTATTSNGTNATIETQPTASVSVTTGTSNPSYSSVVTVPVDMVITNTNGNSASPEVVTITDATDGNVLLQQVPSQNGSITGTITVPVNTTQVDLTVTTNGSSTTTVAVPLQIPVESNGTTTTQPVTSIGNVVIPVNNTNEGETKLADKDGDGIDDTHDAYPDDPTKATKVRYPANGVNTIAFEDFYPSAGDADLNDYVIQFFVEEDLNAQGKIVEIRGAYQHVAKGSNELHSLNLRLPSDLKISFETVVTDSQGNILNTGISKFNPTSTDLQDGLPLLGDSSKTISSNNVNSNGTFTPGNIAKMKIHFQTPVTRAQLGPAPYDIFAKILSKPLFLCNTDKDRGHGNDLDGVDEDNPGNSTGVNASGMDNRNENSFHNREGQCKVNSKTSYPKSAPRATTVTKQFFEIHFPGIYLDSTGKDIYLDANNFPWAIQVPGMWAWQLEGKDIRKSEETGYPKFNSWTKSSGGNDKNWYTTVTVSNVYSLPSEPSKLLAYLKAGDTKSNTVLAITLIIVGISVGVFVSKKLQTT